MSEDIFPFLQPVMVSDTEELPVFKEVKWDFELDKPVYEGGEPVFVHRCEAVAVWAWNALHTERWRHEIYSSDYGNDVSQLIGQPFSGDLKRAEAARYIKECLMVSPYISDVTDMEISFDGDVLNASFKILSIYGQIEMEV